MNFLHWSLLIITFTLSQASNIIYLDNCTYSIDLYKQYLNLLWSSNDYHTLDIQAVYSLSSNHSFIPGHIYTYISRSVALIPLFVQCKYPKNIYSKPYLPFTQCSSTVTNFLTKKNYESTRTYLILKSILSLTNVPLLYIGEYNLILSNCSFKYNSNIYQLKSNDIFKFRIEYEKPINNNITSCQTCNKRTSICQDKKCLCRSGTIPLKIFQNKEYCVDITLNCSYDFQRCLNSKSINILNNHSNQFILILILLISLLFIILICLLWCLYRNTSKQIFKKEKDLSLNQSIFMINRHERTPSTISTTDSIKLNDYNYIDQHILANEYVSTFYEEYPKIISDKNNGDLVLILA
jgi:cbb3-type cytochrome oxidase subunit 3